MCIAFRRTFNLKKLITQDFSTYKRKIKNSELNKEVGTAVGR